MKPHWVLAITLIAAPVVWAQPTATPTHASSADVAQQMELAGQIVLHGSPQGAHKCVTCHGLEGQGQIKAAFPHLAGLPRLYLMRQLQHFDEQARNNPSMQAIAHKLTLTEIQALATYFSNQVPPPIMPSATPPPALGEQLALQGRDAIPACVLCHGLGGRGLGGAQSDAFPPIAGQPAVYLERQLRAWKEGRRPAGPDGLMGAIAKRLTPDEITAVSEYFAAQPTLVAPGTEVQP